MDIQQISLPQGPWQEKSLIPVKFERTENSVTLSAQVHCIYSNDYSM